MNYNIINGLINCTIQLSGNVCDSVTNGNEMWCVDIGYCHTTGIVSIETAKYKLLLLIEVIDMAMFALSSCNAIINMMLNPLMSSVRVV